MLVYATAHLDVHNIIVMGHYGCGGVAAAVTSAVNSEKDAAKDPIEAWIWPIRDIYLNSKRFVTAVTCFVKKDDGGILSGPRSLRSARKTRN